MTGYLVRHRNSRYLQSIGAGFEWTAPCQEYAAVFTRAAAEALASCYSADGATVCEDQHRTYVGLRWIPTARTPEFDVKDLDLDLTKQHAEREAEIRRGAA